MARPTFVLSVAAALSVLTCVIPGRAFAASFAFPTFSQVVDNASTSGLDPESHQLSGTPAGTYNAFTFSVDWSALDGDPYSDEAFWAFSNTGDLSTAGVFYADPGRALNSAHDSAPRTLKWSAYMDNPYQGGDPFHVLMAQSYEGSSASWDNVSIRIFDASRNTTNFVGSTGASSDTWTRPGTLESLSAIADSVPYDVQPFHVDLTTDYRINSLFNDADGFMLVYEDQFDPFDQLNHLRGVFDVNSTGESETADLQLLAGKQYYLVLTGFENSDFGPYTGSIMNSNPMELGTATIGMVPEPATLLALSLLLAKCLFGADGVKRPRRTT
jgi:hypothetical protein